MTGPSLVGHIDVWPGKPQPDATLDHMRVITLNEYENAQVVETAVNIADEVDGKSNAAMARAILEWLREHTRFVPDPVKQQRLNTPVYMLAQIRHDPTGKTGGDCVDLAMLSAALCMAVGMTPKFVAESYSVPCDPLTSPLVHVYTVVQTQNGWLALDTQQPANGTPLVPCRRVEMALL